MYKERPSRVPGAVLWHRADDRGREGPAAHLILPDGCMDLIWSNGRLLVAGPDDHAQLDGAGATTSYTGLRFAPGAAPVVLGVPAHALLNQRVLLTDLWPAQTVRRLTERVARADQPAAALEAIAGGRLDVTGPPDPMVNHIVVRLRAGSAVAETAAAVGLSERQLHRRCLIAFGYGAKTLTRVLRMTRALEAARGGMPFARVAAESGYADQAHLSRDVKALAGVPLTVLIQR